MEYGLRVRHFFTRIENSIDVSILVLMEYGLRDRQGDPGEREGRVLILVLMEYGLRVVLLLCLDHIEMVS